MGTRIASLYAEIGANTDGLDRGLKSAKSGLQGTKMGLKQFATAAALAFGAAGAAAYTMKQAFDFAKEGAALEFVDDKFDKLSKTVGTTSDVLLKDLRKATKGLVSDMELVASATGFMELGLVKTHDEAVRLTNVAGQLGMDMNQLTLTLTNQTTMRFDALGVSVDGFKERVDALKASGMSANDAFNEAFLAQAEDQIKKVGSVADSSEASFMRLEAASEDLSASFKKSLVPVVADVADALADILTYGKRLGISFDESEDSIYNLTRAYDDYLEKTLAAAVANEQLGTGQINLVRRWYQLSDAQRAAVSAGEEVVGWLMHEAAAIDVALEGVDILTDKNYALGKASEFLASTTEAVTEETISYNDEILKFRGEMGSATLAAMNEDEALQALNETLAEQAAAVGAVKLEFAGLIETYSSTDEIDVYGMAIMSLEARIAASGDASGDLTRELYEMQLASGRATEEGLKLAEGHDKITAAIDAGIIKDESEAWGEWDDIVQGRVVGTVDDVITKYGDFTDLGKGESLSGMKKEWANLAGEEGMGSVDSMLNAIGGEDGSAVTTATSMKDMASDIAGPEVTGVLESFANDTLVGTLTGGFRTAWLMASKLSGAISAIATKLEDLDGMSASVSVYMNTIGGGGGGVSGGDFQFTEDSKAAFGGDASGGPVFAGQTSWVGEQGPELVTYGADGYVTPNKDINTGSDNRDLISEIRGLRRELPRMMRDAVLIGSA